MQATFYRQKQKIFVNNLYILASPAHNTNGGWKWVNNGNLVNKHQNLVTTLAMTKMADVAEVATLKKDNVSLQHNIQALIMKWTKNSQKNIR